MIDQMRHKPLRVEPDKGGGGWMLLSTAQLPQVRALLDAHGIYYWEDPVAISVDDQPEITGITFSVKVDPSEVQRLLDSVP
jgi:hypothetical protein